MRLYGGRVLPIAYRVSMVCDIIRRMIRFDGHDSMRLHVN